MVPAEANFDGFATHVIRVLSIALWRLVGTRLKQGVPCGTSKLNGPDTESSQAILDSGFPYRMLRYRRKDEHQEISDIFG